MEQMPFVGGSGHFTAAQLVADAPRDYFSWGFVRHPLDRLVSAYAAGQYSGWIKESESFDTWVRQIELFTRAHVTPQSYFLCDLAGHVLVDFVGRFELLHNDWFHVCRSLKIDYRPLEHINKRNRGPWRSYYDKSLRRYATELFRRDFEVFGY